jgi:hypothetical protein
MNRACYAQATYAWKPLVLQEAVQLFGHVLYLDSGSAHTHTRTRTRACVQHPHARTHAHTHARPIAHACAFDELHGPDGRVVLEGARFAAQQQCSPSATVRARWNASRHRMWRTEIVLLMVAAFGGQS